MAKALPKILTRRAESHKLISWLGRMQIRYEAWKDARSVDKLNKRAKKHG